MNHAFLIMAYNNPTLLGRICHRLEAENHFIFIHIDKKSNLEPFCDACKSIQNLIILGNNERIVTNWGGYSLLATEILLIKKALQHSSHMDYFHLISGADYPCQSNSEFDKFFENNEGKSYMMFDTEEETIKWRKKKYPDRYRLYHFNDKGYNNNSIVNVLKLPIIVFQKVFHIYLRPMIKDVYAGWNWFSWHRKVAEFAMRQLGEHPEHLERMRYCSCIDEVFFHTLLHPHLTELNIIPNNALRYIDWHPTRPTKTLPLVLDERDYQRIKTSRTFFCRKVNPESSMKLLDMLDKSSI